MNKLRTLAVKQWLIKRFKNCANQSYIKDSQEEEYKKDLGELFAKFDLDGSGKILKAELLDLLNKYGINISEQELTNYVKKANSKSGKFITVDQFKQCAIKESSRKFLQKLIHKSNERNKTQYAPTEITKLLSQVHYQSQRGRLLSQIENESISVESKLLPLNKLMDLSNEIPILKIPKLKNIKLLPRTKSTCITNYNSQYNSGTTTTNTTLPSTSNSRFADYKITFRRNATICE